MAGGGPVVLALLVRVCGRSLVDVAVLWSDGARGRLHRPLRVSQEVLSGRSWASETLPDVEKPVHTREPMVSPVRVGQPSDGFRPMGLQRRTP